MGKDEKPFTAEDIAIDVPENKEADVRAILKKHEQAWSGKLGEINVTEMCIDFSPDVKPFKFPQLRAGPKTREIESEEIDKQLNAGVIEPAMSEWATPVLFVPKKDVKRRFCIN